VKGIEEMLPVDAVKEGREAFPNVATIGMKLTDLGNAERLVARYRDRIRYCPPRRKWLTYDTKRWAWDDTGEVLRLAKKTVRAIYGEAEHAGGKEAAEAIAKHATKSEAVERVGAMVKHASTEPGIPVTPDELDSDPMLLNVTNGTIDLRTGELREHDRWDLITKLIPIAFDPGARHEVWERFLCEMTRGDAELGAYLQRVAGYCATGLTKEKHFFFLYGGHDTGKSTFVDALRAGLGEYAMDADFETWVERREGGGNRGDLARLVGARLVVSVEVRPRARFDTRLVKSITGGDPVTCAAKYESEFTYRPTFKILLAANDAPIIRDNDRPMFERCLRIPCDATVPPEKRDPEVKRRLSDPGDAGPAVLAWIVEGCRMWKRDGLGMPEAVRKSSAAYRSEMDQFAQFVADCCVLDQDAFVAAGELRIAYEAHCKESGIQYPLSVREMAARLRARGATDTRTRAARLWNGIRLLQGGEVPEGDTGDACQAFSGNPSREREQGEVYGIAVTRVTSDTPGDGERAAIEAYGGGE
jgi:putative DNA primase/helicase